MSHGSRICRHCGRLNSADAEQCFHCKRPFPGAIQSSVIGLWQSAFGTEFPLTRFYVTLCFAVFVLAFLGSRTLPVWRDSFPGSELLRWGLLVGELARDEPFRYLSAVFLHLNVVHLGFNMFSLIVLGRSTESRVGSGRFVVIFVLTGVAGFVVSDLWHAFRGLQVPTAGASGGLFGLMAAQISSTFARRDPAWKDVLVRQLVYAALFAFLFPVNNAAHAGGFLLGLPLGFLFEKERHPAERNRVFNWIAAALVVLSVASVLLSVRSLQWRIQRQYEQQRSAGLPGFPPAGPDPLRLPERRATS